MALPWVAIRNIEIDGLVAASLYVLITVVLITVVLITVITDVITRGDI